MKGKTMKKTITRILTFMMAFAVFASLALTYVSADAAAPKTMLTLGDSITTGYGLDNYVGGGDPYLCNSYANLIAEALGLEGGKSYINKAVNGDTSSDLAALLPSLESEVKAAELIIITVGGNDLLQAIPVIASMIAGKSVTDLYDAAGILMNITPDQFTALSAKPEFQTKLSSVLMSYITNMNSIATYLKTNAPEARIIFLKQYNPMKNVLGLGNFGDFADSFITPINSTIDTICTSYGFESVDVPSVINVNAAGLTNILEYDIHPNAAGHIEIAKLLASHLGLTLNLPEETTVPETEPVTEPETEPETDPVTEPESDTGECGLDGTAAATDTEPQLEVEGCFSSVSSAVLVLASVCALVVLKKKNN